MKEYSILLLNTAIFELLSVIYHLLVNGRLFVDSTTLICISTGPCLTVSENFCSITTSLMNINMIHSMSILAVSFWYRTRILLDKGAMGKLKLQFLLMILLSPHVVNNVSFVLVASPRDVLETELDRFYDQKSTSEYGLHGFLDVSKIAPALIFGYLLACPTFLTIYIVFARQRLVRILCEKMRLMSVKSTFIHTSFMKVITMNAALVLTFYTILGVLAAAQLVFHHHSPDIEHAFYDVAIFPALANPTLTLYYVRSYRTCINNCLRRLSCCDSSKPATMPIATCSIPMQRRIDTI